MTNKELLMEVLSVLDDLQTETRGWAAGLLKSPLSASTLGLRVGSLADVYSLLDAAREQIQDIEYPEGQEVIFHWSPPRKRKAPREYRLKQTIQALNLIGPMFDPICELLSMVDFPKITDVAGQSLGGD